MTRILIPIRSGNHGIRNVDKVFVEVRFERAPYYLIFDTETNEVERILNTGHHFGGSNAPFSIVKNHEVNVVFAAYIGSRSSIFFKNNEKLVYQVSTELSVKFLIDKFQSNEFCQIKTSSKANNPSNASCCPM